MGRGDHLRTSYWHIHAGGTYAGVEAKLPYLRDMGITAIELMPIHDVPGRRNWGYDGVLLNAPNAQYGRPQDLKRLLRAAHEVNIMVYLDVVYNHFGPQLNYLHAYRGKVLYRSAHDWLGTGRQSRRRRGKICTRVSH
jgi:1,4-alpha-glucan branching enzyme